MLQQDELQLRPFSLTDKSRFALLANNKNIWNNIRNRMPHPYEESDAADFIKMATNKKPNTILAIEWKGELVGAIGLHPEDESDVYAGTAEMGYWVGEPFWGRGIASKAVAIMIKYGFEELKLRRIFAAAYAYNIASMKVLEKNGFQKEGISKQAVIKNGKIWDEHRYGLVW